MSLCHSQWHRCAWATPCALALSVCRCVWKRDGVRVFVCECAWVWLWTWLHLFIRVYVCVCVSRWPEDRCGCLAFQEPMSKTFSSVSAVHRLVCRRSWRVMNKWSDREDESEDERRKNTVRKGSDMIPRKKITYFLKDVKKAAAAGDAESRCSQKHMVENIHSPLLDQRQIKDKDENNIYILKNLVKYLIMTVKCRKIIKT